MSVVIEVTPITFEGTESKEHISRLKICTRREPIAYASSESKMLRPPSRYLAYFDNRTVS